MDKEKMLVVTREQMEEFKRIACDMHMERIKKMYVDKGKEHDPMVELGEFVTCCLVTSDMIDLMFGKETAEGDDNK